VGGLIIRKKILRGVLSRLLTDIMDVLIDAYYNGKKLPKRGEKS